MKKEITISELARLMNVSVHQIRYFEEKGVLEPAYIDNNQYRMYNTDQMYDLSHILMLRKLGISVQDIKACMTSYDVEQYEQIFKQSLQELEAELLRLTKLQHFIRKVLHEHQHTRTHSQNYEIKNRAVTYLQPWVRLQPHEELHARRLAEQADSMPNLFEADVHYIWGESGTVIMAFETTEPSDCCLPNGNYLSYHTQIREEKDLEPIIQQFYDDAAAMTYHLTGPLVLIEKSYLSLFSKNKLHYELLSLIKP
ncbi:helix-turn-helix domain-containing protein [Paenibacillus aquistagni]|uniref:helix-turn-helix domain-containing protein n=1 Tax=Paenibacillus aquistagni TaxID=1852522 RepID=UPI000B5140D1|nr:MerR family transcriptional regulator [Paenibacillus aquistagni]